MNIVVKLISQHKMQNKKKEKCLEWLFQLRSEPEFMTLQGTENANEKVK